MLEQLGLGPLSPFSLMALQIIVLNHGRNIRLRNIRKEPLTSTIAIHEFCFLENLDG